jgi:hypothetical protein
VALTEADDITTLSRYLPPMQAIVLTLKEGAPATTSLTVTLNTNRIVTDASQIERAPAPDPAPKRLNGEAIKLPKGIMTVTAVNPVSPRCVSRLLIGQGYHAEVLNGEDAMLTTFNINSFSMTNTPTTPFNIYASEGEYGLSIDLRDEVLNIPVSFYMSPLPYDPVTNLWFTGVNAIDGELVLYDALLDIERPILDGICLTIETPETSHENRYYIRRKGFNPSGTGDDIATDLDPVQNSEEKAMKIIKNGHVLILRNGHVYTMYGQEIR